MLLYFLLRWHLWLRGWLFLLLFDYFLLLALLSFLQSFLILVLRIEVQVLSFEFFQDLIHHLFVLFQLSLLLLAQAGQFPLHLVFQFLAELVCGLR